MRKVHSCLISLLFAAVGICAQTPTATLSGVVRDEQKGLITGATVNLRQIATGKARKISTDNAGRYSFTNLEPGHYELRVEASGYKVALQSGLTLSVGGALVADVTMSVGDLSEQVTIEAREPLVEPGRAGLSRVIESSEIESLPNIGRNFVDFVKLSSGVALGREAIYGGVFKEPDVGVGAVAAPRLSFGGQGELATLIQVDGADNIQTFTGLPRATPSQETVSEFRVLNSTYLAEYGRAMGGFVNIITRSGTNNLKGSIYYFGINDALNARSVLNSPDANALRQSQYGTTLGGPIRKDSAFYFVNYEGQRRDESNGFAEVIQQNLAAINAFRARFKLAPETLNQLRSNNYDQFLGKVDKMIGDNALSLRYNYLTADTTNFLGAGSHEAALSSSARNNDVTDQALVGTYISVFSSRASNEGRLQLARRSFGFPSVYNEPTIEVSDLLTMGRPSVDLDNYQEDRIQATDNFSYTVGPHQFKAGGDYNYLHDSSVWSPGFPAQIIFPSLDRLLSFTPTTAPDPTTGPVIFWWPSSLRAPGYQVPVAPFTQAVPSVDANSTGFMLNHSIIGGFFQDQWKATSKLSLSLGIRYDVEGYPSRFVQTRDMNNLQPRIGLAYNWNRKGVVRAGFGLFNDRLAQSIGQIFNATEYNNRGNLPNAAALFPGVATFAGRFSQTIVGGPPATSAAINFLTTGQTPLAGAPTLNDTLVGNLDTPYTTQASLQLSQELPGGLALTASYLYVHGVKLIGRSANLNVVATPPPPNSMPAPGKPYFGARIFPELGDIVFVTNLGDSVYHGGTLEIERRFGMGFGIHGSYTFSKTMSDGGVDSPGALNDFPETPGVSEWALSRQHLAHRFTLSLLEQAPKWTPLLREFKFSSLVVIESGRPFTIFTGFDANNDGNPLSDRPGALGRNTLMGPGFASVDLRVARPIKLTDRLNSEFSFDFFNLFNRLNIRDITTFYGSSDLNAPPVAGFGSTRSVFNPREIQFGVKLRF
ncbi:MAG: carboxypeptidase regulatory-like domain-containing protein [Chloracidobacterium sp.]|nr:carboxypeptidase regulatory-like domain-containing protein [Chloracidobacterium sp.]